MRNAVMLAVSVMFGVITLGIILAVSGKMSRGTELQSSLSQIAEETVENAITGEEYPVESSEEYVADFVEQLAFTLDAKADVEVRVFKADPKRGVLSMKVTEEFPYPNGKKGTVSSGRTVIWEQGQKTETEQCEVDFYLRKPDQTKTCYKSYRVIKGDGIPKPAEPYMEGRQFAGWRDINDYIADFSQPVMQDQSYYAEWY